MIRVNQVQNADASVKSPYRIGWIFVALPGFAAQLARTAEWEMLP